MKRLIKPDCLFNKTSKFTLYVLAVFVLLNILFPFKNSLAISCCYGSNLTPKCKDISSGFCPLPYTLQARDTTCANCQDCRCEGSVAPSDMTGISPQAAANEKEDSVPVVPQLQIQIPGFEGFSKDIQICLQEGKTLEECEKGQRGLAIPWIGEYIIAIYKWALRAIAILAIVMIMWGGLEWVLSRGNASQITQAKTRIGSALMGVLIIVGLNVFLSAINPQLTIFKPIILSQIEKVVIVPMESDIEEGATGMPSNGQSIDMGGSCFPVSSASIKQNTWNFGNRRSSGKRCHAGVDILTNWRSGNDQVLAMADGKVLSVSGFYTCSAGTGKGGHVSAIFVSHKGYDYTTLYGEIDDDAIAVKTGDIIKAGQLLGRASRCGMLHLEMYEYGAMKNEVWYPPSGQTVGNQSNYCRDYFYNSKPDKLLDPTQTLGGLQNKQCQ